MNVLGISYQPTRDTLAPLDPVSRVRFDGHSTPFRGYFHLIGPAFEEFSINGRPIEGLHTLAIASGAGLTRALAICAELDAAITARPQAWRDLLGTVKRPGCPEMPLQPLIVRRRALAIVRNLKGMFEFARVHGGEVVFGSGALYRPLAGIKAEPGGVYYS